MHACIRELNEVQRRSGKALATQARLSRAKDGATACNLQKQAVQGAISKKFLHDRRQPRFRLTLVYILDGPLPGVTP